MTFIPVDELPIQQKKAFKKRNGDHLREFLNMKVKYAKMDITEMDYMNVDTAYASTHTMIKFYGFPIKARLINHELYLINLELEGVR